MSEETDALHELRHVWLENFFNVDQIIARIEECDKDCKTCDAQHRLDCLLETKEHVHSLALSFKSMFAVLLNGVMIAAPVAQEQQKEIYT